MNIAASDLHQRVRTWNAEHLSAGRASINAFMGDEFEVGSTGDTVTTESGRELINLAGYGVTLLGGRHPRVVSALHDQLDRAGMSSRVIGEWLPPMVAHELAQTFARKDLTKVHFANSGAEAIEAAIKLARAHGIRTMVTTHRGFHGKTTGALSLTGNRLYQDPFRPLLDGVVTVPYGDTAAMERALADAGGNAVVFLEPIQGEAGVRLPPDGYLGEVSRACASFGALLAVDEIQTGLGRTGLMWAHEQDSDCQPDMVLTGKVLSGGMVPVAAMVTTERTYRPFDKDPFLHSSTFAANPLAMRAAQETIRIIHDEDVLARVETIGVELGRRLALLAAEFPQVVREVRGRGCLWALEMLDEGTAGQVLLGMIEQGVLVNHSLNAGSVIRLTPSAYLDPATTDHIVRALHTVLDHVIAFTPGES